MSSFINALPVWIWIAAVIGLAATTVASGWRFNAMHSRRYGQFMSVGERFQLFLASPRRYVQRALPDRQAESRAFLSRVDDPAIERIRIRAIRFAIATAAVAVLGLPVMFVVMGIVKRAPSVETGEWLTVLFWIVLLMVAILRRAAKPIILLFGLALVATAAASYVSGLP